MKRLVIILLVLAFSVAPAFGLSLKQERDIALTDKLVHSEQENRELNEKLAHSKKGEKFYWAVIGMAILYAIDSNSGGNDSPTQQDKPRCK